MNKLIQQNPCGCILKQIKGRYIWELCDEAKRLKQDYEKDFSKRKYYDEHFNLKQ